MASKKREHTYQIYDDTWYKTGHGRPPYYHECCDCSMVHLVEYKFENGHIFERWTVDKKETTRARKISGKKAL